MQPTDDTSPAVKAGRREWLGLAVLALPALLLSVDASVLFLALPQLSADLGATGVEQLWIIDVYGFLIGGFLITMGGLGDRTGRRRLLLIGAAVFGLMSVLAAYSTSPEMLIAARALMGIAGATVMPSALALISNMFPDPKQMGLAIAVFIGCFMGGAAIGPAVGGAMLTNFWWGSVFLINVPVMLLIVLAGPALLPEYRSGESGGIDLISAVLSLGAILPVIYGLKELARNGWAPLPALVLVAGLVVGYLFIRRQKTQDNPLLDLKLFKHRAFTGALMIMLLGSVMMSGLALFFTLFLQSVRGLSALQTGLWMVISAVALVVGSMGSPILAQKRRPGIVIAISLGISMVGFLLMTQADRTSSLALPIIAVAMVSLGAGGFASLSTGLLVGAVPPERAGSASSVSEMSGELGGALGVALIGTLGTTIYRSLLDVPSGVPEGAAEAARENITGAVASAAELPGAAGAALLDAARDAFTTALRSVGVVSAVIAAALVVVAITVLRQFPPTGEAAEGDATPEGNATAEADAGKDAGTDPDAGTDAEAGGTKGPGETREPAAKV
ncbi:MFS transporter [Streptomyces sp. NPDC006365]|uniref:MFS transporter n=1 Tax=Streptomyces sp. NPDC006365 TaxID=3364744 RepID=UPI00369968A7